MSSFFELFSPSMRFQREQKDLDKMLVVKTPTMGKGPVQIDLDKGTITVRKPASEITDTPHEVAPGEASRNNPEHVSNDSPGDSDRDNSDQDTAEISTTP